MQRECLRFGESRVEGNGQQAAERLVVPVVEGCAAGRGQLAVAGRAGGVLVATAGAFPVHLQPAMALALAS